MKIELWQALIACIASGGFAALFRVGALNRRDDANSAVALASAYARLIDQLEHRIISLERENVELRKRVVHLEEQVDGRKGST